MHAAKPKQKNFDNWVGARLTEARAKQLAKTATERGLSQADVIREALDAHLGAKPSGPTEADVFREVVTLKASMTSLLLAASDLKPEEAEEIINETNDAADALVDGALLRSRGRKP